ncbi:MAG: aspartate aminotransferase family protein [Tistlia sp.]|uniref:aspartate aminotransferase family protein n=1 Tax=Tistlia sp. TaxID=3057121 RepID=UPI0034A3C9B0
MTSPVFYRNLNNPPRRIVRGEGVYLYDDDGRRYLDAVGGAAVVAIGHGVPEILDAVAGQAGRIPYVYGASFTHPWQEELSAALLSIAPPSMAAAYWVTGGSEATETALKMARQYHLHRGRPSKFKVVARSHAFHGVTMASLELSDRPVWKEPFAPMLRGVPRIVPPYCYRCPFGKSHPSCGTACAGDLERVILQEGPDSVAAFIAEPTSGTSITGLMPVDDYYRRIREICDRYDVLFIADEVLVGYGRTGSPFALSRWGVEADIITCGKTIGSGYAPLGAVLASERVVEAFRAGTGEFTHGFTYAGHPLSCFIGLKVFEYMQAHRLFERAAERGVYLHRRLQELATRHTTIGEIRGAGLLAGLELVADRGTRAPLPAELKTAERVVAAARERGVLLIVGNPNVNYGRGGDQIQITPPYVITEAEIDRIVEVLDEALASVATPEPASA